MKKSWIQNMDTVKAAILDNDGFIWQQMVNNGTGTRPIVPKGAACAPTLRAACTKGSVQQRGALNYGIVRGVTASQHHTVDYSFCRARSCSTHSAAIAIG